MCIAIANYATSRALTADEFRNCARSNADGIGLAFVEPNEQGLPTIARARYINNTEQALADYLWIRANYPASDVLLHFRLATHGAANEENCHPFGISERTVFCHNGILSGYGHKAFSDTRDFCVRVLQKLPDNFFLDRDLVSLIEDHIGSGNKLIFLDAEHGLHLANAKAGHTTDFGWASNHSYQGWGRYGGAYASRWDEWDGYMGTGGGKTYTSTPKQTRTQRLDAKKAGATATGGTVDASKCPVCAGAGINLQVDETCGAVWCHECQDYVATVDELEGAETLDKVADLFAQEVAEELALSETID